MGIFNRFVNVLRANANAALDQAEDPELMLTQMISDLETQKREAKQRMTEALALQKRFERQTEQEEAEAQKWEDKAVLAVQKGKDDLAKDALMRKKEHARRSEEFRQQLASHARTYAAQCLQEAHIYALTFPCVEGALTYRPMPHTTALVLAD